MRPDDVVVEMPAAGATGGAAPDKSSNASGNRMGEAERYAGFEGFGAFERTWPVEVSQRLSGRGATWHECRQAIAGEHGDVNTFRVCCRLPAEASSCN
jgi:hypothetical protein